MKNIRLLLQKFQENFLIENKLEFVGEIVIVCATHK